MIQSWYSVSSSPFEGYRYFVTALKMCPPSRQLSLYSICFSPLFGPLAYNPPASWRKAPSSVWDFLHNTPNCHAIITRQHLWSATPEHVHLAFVCISVSIFQVVYVAGLIGCRLYGLALAQTVQYFRLYPSDRLFLKIVVCHFPPYIFSQFLT